MGDNVLLQRLFPGEVTSSVQSVAAGASHSLIVRMNGSLWATGANSAGQLGDGSTTDRPSPVQILAGDVQSVAVGSSTACS
ncbi:MAG: hypothetical protein IPL39_07705 [Opitutaceae bacterium]|nr:hypothetical protein [Opitutaceae bacterium]